MVALPQDLAEGVERGFTLVSPRPRISLLGCPLDVVSLEEAVDGIDVRVAERWPCQHVSMNAAKLVLYQKEELLWEAVARCELVTADGQPLVWASRLLSRPLPERVAGIDLFLALAERASHRGYRIFLLGAEDHIVRRAREALLARYPALIVVGARNGFWSAEEESEVVEEVAAARPDMLFVALETPTKELFLARHRDRLEIPFVMGVGGAFDILAGKRRRAPKLLQKLGLEWLYRLSQDPRRLARRYIVGNSRFVLLVVRELAMSRG